MKQRAPESLNDTAVAGVLYDLEMVRGIRKDCGEVRVLFEEM